jgi:hypothetical protein
MKFANLISKQPAKLFVRYIQAVDPVTSSVQ